MRYNTLESTIVSCKNLSTASAGGRWEKKNCPVKDLDPVAREPGYKQERACSRTV